MGMSTRAHIQSLSSIGPILVKIFEVVERWVPVEVWVHDSIHGHFTVTVSYDYGTVRLTHFTPAWLRTAVVSVYGRCRAFVVADAPSSRCVKVVA